jgi:hypothetical protein
LSELQVLKLELESEYTTKIRNVYILRGVKNKDLVGTKLYKYNFSFCTKTGKIFSININKKYYNMLCGIIFDKNYLNNKVYHSNNLKAKILRGYIIRHESDYFRVSELLKVNKYKLIKIIQDDKIEYTKIIEPKYDIMINRKVADINRMESMLASNIKSYSLTGPIKDLIDSGHFTEEEVNYFINKEVIKRGARRYGP